MISRFGYIMDVYYVNNFPPISEQDFLPSRVPEIFPQSCSITATEEATALRRLATSSWSDHWSVLADHLPPNQKAPASTLPSKPNRMHAYVSLCPAPKQYTKINCAHDKNLIPGPDLIDNFQRSYEALKVPYPLDNAIPI
uniref:Uncharacterized protein n=1 Tax=Glossina austeni TaxID=7395 RepID=A0A1A9VIM2_GLOAU